MRKNMVQTKIIELPLKTGLVGLGYFGQKIYPYLEEAGFSAEKICARLADILEDPKISTVLIATPFETHYEIAKKCLLAGKNVYLEKPSCESSSELAELITLAKQKGLMIFTDFTFAFSPSIRKIHEILTPQRWREIKQIEMEFSQYGRFDQGHVVWLLGTHLLSILGLFMDLDQVNVTKVLPVNNIKLAEACQIQLQGAGKSINLILNLHSPEKNRKIR